MLKTKTQIATAIAILFHTIGFVGMFVSKDFFVTTTALNLLLMLGLLIYTQKKINTAFIIFFILCFSTGIAVEIIGTSTGYLFGQYEYGTMLGPVIKNVPLVIGVNWFIIMYCCGVAVHTVIEKLSNRLEIVTGERPKAIKLVSIISDGAMLAVIFDWIMEPASIKLGFWKWLGDGEIPAFNYLTWFGISTFIMVAFAFLKFEKQNIFAVHLLMIMAMFFMLIRTFL
jgi:bisanhydrobacterioruberin hydratase